VRKAVIGLGNPGARYERTRHNAGFFVVDLLAERAGVVVAQRRHDALWAEIRVADSPLLLVKPQAFMNRSGLAVAAFAAERGLEPTDVLVVHDDLDLPLARIKLKRGGGTAGHRGLESIVEQLGTRDFPRLRIGIGRPPIGQEVVDFVLCPFPESELVSLKSALAASVSGVEAWCAVGIEAAMNVVNGAKAEEPGSVVGS